MNGKRCRGTNRAGEQCKLPPMKGVAVCRMHGGKAPQVQAKARDRSLEDNVRGILGRIDPTAPQEHPVEMLMKLINMKWAEVLWLRMKVQEMGVDDLAWGRVQHEVGIGPEGPIDKEVFKAEMNIWWRLLREAENQLATWTAAAAKAGVDERLAKVSEETANEFLKALNMILNALALTDEQRAQVPEVVPKILRSIAV